MNKKADANWYIIGLILALIVLAVIIVIFRNQIGTVLQNIGLLSPKNETLVNISKCLTDPTLPECVKFN